MNRTELLGLFAGLALGNFTMVLFPGFEMRQAIERTFFQSIPLAIVAFYTKKP